MKSKTIVVLGSCSVDFTTYATRLPKPGETLHGSKFLTSFGGKGANQCVAASKLGAKTALVASIGNDSWGKDYKKYLTDLGIDTTHTKQKNDISTGIAQIMVSSSGENQIVIVAGANDTLSIDDEAKNHIINADILVCQLETPLETTLEAFHLCKGLKILNAAPGRSDIDEILKHTTILCVNESEASIMTSEKVENIHDAVNAITKLLNKVLVTVIITLGKDGALYATNDDRQVYHVKCDTVKPVDTTGAGDAFIGALSMLLASEPSKPLHQLVGAACRVATLSVTKEGTQTSYEKIDGLLDKEYEYDVLNNDTLLNK